MSLSRDIREAIKQKYITPFLNSINTAKLNQAEVIRSAIYILNRYETSVFSDNFLSQIEKGDKTLTGNRLLTTPSCHPSFLALARLYFDPAVQLIPENKDETERTNKAFGGYEAPDMVKQLLAGMAEAEMQTRIREILHDEINPVPCLSEATIRALLPEDDKNAQIMYVTSRPIKIRHKLLLFSIARENINNDEIIASMRDAYDLKLFPSLYQAVEQAYFDSAATKMAPVWAVVFNGNIKEATRGTYQYNINNRPAMCCKAMATTKENIIPLRGVLLEVKNGFADYVTLNVADIPYARTEHQHVAQPKK